MRRRLSIVGAAPNDQSRRDYSSKTLGDLLYDDETKPRIQESDWVALVDAIAAADQGALHALYERTHRMVFTLIMRIIGNAATAEELTLDVFHDVWRRASRYDGAGGSVVGWIMNQARSRAIDRLRFERRKKRVNPVLDGPLPTGDPNTSEDIVAFGEQARRLRDALMHLTAEERQTIETAFFCELTYAEAATELNQPLGTIKTRIRSALAKLRVALATELCVR